MPPRYDSPRRFAPTAPDTTGSPDALPFRRAQQQKQHQQQSLAGQMLDTAMLVALLPSQQRVSVCNLYTIYWLLLFLLFYLNAYSPCMLLALAIHSICT